MSTPTVEQKRSAGLLIESDQRLSFYLALSTTPTEEPPVTTQIEEPAVE